MLIFAEDCSFVYNRSIFSFNFIKNKTCDFISWYLDVLKDVIMVSVIAIVDITTVMKVRRITRTAALSSNTEANAKRRAEISLLKQACAQGVVFVVELFTYFYLSFKFENKWPIWALTTVAWNIVHLSDP
ncbi:hypothetical protein OESDEN_02039 [Oesophagostomum dentatum]|uniref:7TM GPCR serpentine receptor class x (Srx) domain-containing protein n=1 Tax=Oesophagostomum dentatum TaxID=61180 RepID=A0A0B1TPC0_OESDE|nr:hypothetical protein OESDEN_02039 [Oesophagostomum dentatum]